MFSQVCLSVCRRGGTRVTITHDALDLTVQPPAQKNRLGTQPPCPRSDIWWWPLKLQQAGGTHPTGMLSCNFEHKNMIPD